MFRGILTDLFRPRELTGVNLQIVAQGQLVLETCSVLLKGDVLKVRERKKGLKSIAHLGKQVNPGPVALNISGKGIITRKIEAVEKLDQQAVHKVLPNANINDFYFQMDKQEDCAVVSVIRRTELDELLEGFKAEGFNVVSVSLNSVAQEPSFDVAFRLLLDVDPLEIDCLTLSNRNKELFSKAKLKGIFVVTAPLLLLVLMCNFYLFSHFSTELEACARRSNLSAAEVNKLRSLEREIQHKTAFVKTVGWSAGLQKSFIIDRLLAKLPVQIKLQELSVNPAQKSDGGLAAYESAMVKLKGSCTEAGVVNNWLFSIKAERWVKNCRIDDYSLAEDIGRGLFSMTIELGEDAQ